MAKSKKPAPPKKASASPSAQSYDTSLAANIAAKRVVQMARRGSTMEPAQQKESGAFKDLKQNLNKPAGHVGGGSVANVMGHRPSNLPTGPNKQVAHNQTLGNLNSRGVPRRTPG